MEDKNKRKSIIYLVIGIVTLIVLVAGATYAYFQSQTKNGTSFNTNVTAGTTDNLTFSINDLDVGFDNITDNDGNNGIVINATQQNFGEQANSIGDGVTGKAILIANDSSKEASYKYYVYVNIINNDLEYSSYKNEVGEVKLAPLDDDDKTTYTNPVPELIMTIRKNKKPYTEPIEGITQTTIITKDGEVTGYDITEVRRNILIEEATIEVVEETKDLRTEDTWEISIILKNLETNQQLNTDKEVKGEVIIQSEKIEPIQNKLLADANKLGQEETLLYHNGEIIIDEQIMDAEDYSYRYAGASDDVHNYICFGGPCSNNPENENYSNLYRIIGIFPTDSSHTTYQMKIIKANYATENELGGEGIGAYHKTNVYFWNKKQNGSGNDTNDWSQSNLNTINLNEIYLNYIKEKDNEKWTNMIEKHKWIIAGNNWGKIGGQNAKNVYKNEIVNPEIGEALPNAAIAILAKVGLMYTSDYGYAAYKEAWSTKILYDYHDETTRANNWMYMNNNTYEWTITRRTESSISAFIIDISGNLQSNVVTDISYAVRPCLYLNSDVKIIDGDGTSTNPYIISE